MTQQASVAGYSYGDSKTICVHAYLLPVVCSELAKRLSEIRHVNDQPGLFDLGRGNGSVASIICQDGWTSLAQTHQ
jgi:hypothetical protein